MGGAELAFNTQQRWTWKWCFKTTPLSSPPFRAELHPVGVCLRVTVRMAASCHGIHGL